MDRPGWLQQHPRLARRVYPQKERCKPSQPARIGNTAQRPANELKLFSRHNAPGHKRRSRTATAIDAMTLDYSKRSFFKLIPHSTAKTASIEVHIVTPNTELRHSLRRHRHDEAGQQRFSSRNTQQKEWRLLPQVIRSAAWISSRKLSNDGYHKNGQHRNEPNCREAHQGEEPKRIC